MTLIDIIFRIIFIVLMFRILLSWVPHDRGNQIVSLIYMATDPLLKPFRSLLPPVQGGIDLSPILLLLSLYLIKTTIFSIIHGITSPVSLAFDILYFSILVRVGLSWIPHNRFNPIIGFIYKITEPILRPFRQIMPPALGGIDFSPILAIIILNLLQIILRDILYSL